VAAALKDMMDTPLIEHVVLVDEHDRPIGTADKRSVHHADTPLHRGFSVFLFNAAGNLLLQQRSFGKTTWPGVWSNSCCGHIQLGETAVHAMQRRIHEELGIAGAEVTVVLPEYRYRFARDGVVENEFCPVAVGVIDQAPWPNPEEVAAIRWTPWDAFLAELDRGSDFSEWCIEEARLLAADATFQAFLARLRVA
jgi:isopentenyl-diphosphate delta-isomerase